VYPSALICSFTLFTVAVSVPSIKKFHCRGITVTHGRGSSRRPRIDSPVRILSDRLNVQRDLPRQIFRCGELPLISDSPMKDYFDLLSINGFVEIEYVHLQHRGCKILRGEGWPPTQIQRTRMCLSVDDDLHAVNPTGRNHLVEELYICGAIPELSSDGSASNDSPEDGKWPSEEGFGAGQVSLKNPLPDYGAADGDAINNNLLHHFNPKTELWAEPFQKTQRSLSSFPESETGTDHQPPDAKFPAKYLDHKIGWRRGSQGAVEFYQEAHVNAECFEEAKFVLGASEERRTATFS